MFISPIFFEAKSAAKLVIILHRSIHFYVNKPKFIVEIFSSETIFFFLTLFRGGVTRFNKILCTFAGNFSFTFKTFKIMTKKKLYERPSMKVVLLKRQPQLLAGSNGTGNLGDYNWNTPGEE